eukprot:RCo035045
MAAVHFCETTVTDLLNTSLPVSYLVMKLKELGSEASIKCRRTRDLEQDGQVLGGYQLADRTSLFKKGDILVDAESWAAADKKKLEKLLTHELIHNFDDVRAELSPENCYHQACSEIRANRLSGDCSWDEELLRGNLSIFSIKQQGQRCVERRAALSLDLNPKCRGRAFRYIGSVWEQCYNDVAPFLRAPFG